MRGKKKKASSIRKRTAKLRPVQVAWMDHAMHSTGWVSTDNANKCNALLCHSAGFLVGQDKNVIRVSVNAGPQDENQVGDTMVILKSCIKRLKYLK